MPAVQITWERDLSALGDEVGVGEGHFLFCLFSLNFDEMKFWG